MGELSKKSTKKALPVKKQGARASKAVAAPSITSSKRVSRIALDAASLKQLVRKVQAEQAEKRVRVTSSTNKKMKVAIQGFHSHEVAASAPLAQKNSPATRFMSALRSSKATTSNQSTPDSAPTVDTVAIPAAASERLISKTKALSAWYAVRFPHYAARTAYVAGFIFMAAAGSVLAAQASTQYNSWHDLEQAALCSAIDCLVVPTTTNVPTGSGTTTQSTWSIQFRTTPPSPLKDKVAIIVRGENIRDLTISVESRTTSRSTEITAAPETSGGDKSFLLDPAQLPPGEYQLRARARTNSEGKLVNQTGPAFVIEEAKKTIAVVPPQTTGSSTTGVSTTTLNTTQDHTTPSTTTLPALPINKTPATVASTTAAAGAPPSLQSGKIFFTLDLTNDDEYAAKLKVTGAASVEMFAQRAQANEPFFIGNAKKFDGDYWYYNFPSSTLPNGDYSLFARAKLVAGGVTISERLPLHIAVVQPKVVVPPPPPATATNGTSTGTTTSAVLKPTLTIEHDGVTVERTKYLEAPAIETPEQPETTMVAPLTADSEKTVTDFVSNQLSSNSDSVNDLLKRYASAYQSGDESLKTLARRELTEKRTALAGEVLDDPKANALANEIDGRMTEEFERLQKRVEKFETLLKNRDRETLTKDSDADGISDHDEKNLYNTDPNNSDSDGDGINDGAEITGGYNPSDANAESMMRFASPKDFGLVRSDVLEVNAVTPIIESDTTRGTAPVQAEIRGKGLPNSFVTIFIYSSPVVVTVKTDADGSFVYEYDRELEDGAHEVYVTVTDNTGDVVAKSTPFRFVKEAEAFTKVGDSDSYITTEPSTKGIGNIFNVVVALVVLTFGLILVIIGLVLRREHPVVATETPTI